MRRMCSIRALQSPHSTVHSSARLAGHTIWEQRNSRPENRRTVHFDPTVEHCSGGQVVVCVPRAGWRPCAAPADHHQSPGLPRTRPPRATQTLLWSAGWSAGLLAGSWFCWRWYLVISSWCGVKSGPARSPGPLGDLTTRPLSASRQNCLTVLHCHGQHRPTKQPHNQQTHQAYQIKQYSFY